MPHQWAMYREKVVLDAAFAQELAAEIAFRGDPQGTPLPHGSKLVIAAGSITLAQDFAVPGRSLADFEWVFLTDSFDSGGSTIEVSGARGTDGRTGAAGANAHSFEEPGTDGGDGDDGGLGASGGSVTIACLALSGVRIVARGGSGGNGGSGGKGGDGESGSSGADVSGTDGGNGGSGGSGGNGGAGGNVRVFYVYDWVPGGFDSATVVDVSGGSAGQPGNGGAGGNGGWDATDGQDGSAGSVGGTGSAGPLTVQQLTEVTFWSTIATIDPDASAEWSAYRTRLGEFLFRSYRADDPALAGNPILAWVEFAKALALNPANAGAEQLQRQLVGNQNPLGLVRQYDLVPDFPRYEQVVTDYGPMVLGLFQTASFLLANANDLGLMQNAVSSQLAHIEQTVDILRTEQAAAALGVEAAQSELDRVDGRRSQLGEMFQQREEELRSAPFDSFINGILGVGTMLIGFGTGASAVATIAGLAKPVWSSMSDQNLLSLTNWEKGAQARDEVSDWVGGLADIAEHTTELISQGQVLSDIWGSQADPQYQSLLNDAAMLTFERHTAALRKEQADLEKAAVDQRIAQAQEDIVRAQQQLSELVADLRQLGDMIMTLVRRAQGYIDVILKYVFFAARALEIYALVNASGLVSYDYGFIHPDQEEDGFRALSRGDASKVLALLGQYLSSWSRLPDVLYFRDAYESYSMSGQAAHDVCFVSITEKGQLQAFATSQELYLTVDRQQLAPTRFEDKVESVTIGLIGAAAAAPGITCIVEHLGNWTARRRDGSEVVFGLPPRRAPVLATASRAALDTLAVRPSEMDLGFWGRGAAANWHIFIEPHEMTSNQVDFQNLVAIHVGVGYRSFIK
jgi:hypothetical protein